MSSAVSLIQLHTQDNECCGSGLHTRVQEPRCRQNIHGKSARTAVKPSVIRAAMQDRKRLEHSKAHGRTNFGALPGAPE